MKIASALVVLHLAAVITLAGEPWTRHTIDDSSRGADGVRLADANGDGLPDIVTGWEEGGVARAYLHPGFDAVSGKWPAVTVGKVRAAEDAVFADLDGDGRMDAVTCCEGNTRSIFFHWAPGANAAYLDGSLWRTASVPCADERKLQWMFALPLDVDGRNGIDLIVGAKNQGACIGWLESPPDPRDLAGWKFHQLRDAGWIMSLEAHDMDGDGDFDVLASDRKGDRRGVFWLENPGADAASRGAAWREHLIGTPDGQAMFLASGRVGTIKEPAVMCAVNGGGIAVFRPGEAKAWTMEEIPLPEGVGTGKGIGSGDLDGDGDFDLAFTCEKASGELSGVRWLEFTGDPRESWRSHEIGGPEGVKFDRLELLDLDGDGDLDLLTCEERDQLGVVWYENPFKAKEKR